MAERLDLSIGKEHQIFVEVSGWDTEHKSAFAAEAQQLDGVTAVNGAGGSTSFYVHYDPAKIEDLALKTRLKDLAQSIGALRGSPIGKVEERPILNSLAKNEATKTIADQFMTPDNINANGLARVDAATWTGITSLKDRVIAFKQLAPIALAAVTTLITQLEVRGENGGPPLDERKEAIDALRALHEALSSLLASIEKPNFEWVDGEGLIASCAQFAIRSAETLKNDPIPFAVSGLLMGLCSVLGFPEVGGCLGAIVLEMQKRNKEVS